MKSIKESQSDKIMMDEDDINDLIQSCKTLKYNFHGVFAANHFPEKMNRNSFLIVNAATAENIGTLWLRLCKKNHQLLFADPLGQPTSSYKHLYQRIISVANNNNINQPIQRTNSKLCGLFRIYIAHFVFNAQKLKYINDNELIRFAFHMMF